MWSKPQPAGAFLDEINRGFVRFSQSTTFLEDLQYPASAKDSVCGSESSCKSPRGSASVHAETILKRLPVSPRHSEVAIVTMRSTMPTRKAVDPKLPYTYNDCIVDNHPSLQKHPRSLTHFAFRPTSRPGLLRLQLFESCDSLVQALGRGPKLRRRAKRRVRQ